LRKKTKREREGGERERDREKKKDSAGEREREREGERERERERERGREGEGERPTESSCPRDLRLHSFFDAVEEKYLGGQAGHQRRRSNAGCPAKAPPQSGSDIARLGLHLRVPLFILRR
jgi:hypothetical protein